MPALSMALGWFGCWIWGWKGHPTIHDPWAAQEEGPGLSFVVFWALLSSALVASHSVQETFISWGILKVIHLPEHVFKVFAQALARTR